MWIPNEGSVLLLHSNLPLLTAFPMTPGLLEASQRQIRCHMCNCTPQLVPWKGKGDFWALQGVSVKEMVMLDHGLNSPSQQ